MMFEKLLSHQVPVDDSDSTFVTEAVSTSDGSAMVKIGDTTVTQHFLRGHLRR